MRYLFWIPVFMLLAFGHAYATTWNEPWQDDVVRLADVFLKVRITSVSEFRAAGDVVKVLAGEEPGKSVIIEGYSQLAIGSMTVGHNRELHLPFKIGSEYYILVKRGPKGTYQLPTPTSGWAFVEKGDVYATYRHSYHKALVPVDVYELTMRAIFDSAKGKTVDSSIPDFIREQIALPPAKLGNLDLPETKRFFLQHVALELIFHTGSVTELQRLEPFLASPEYQVQISAVRAAGRVGTPESRERLMRFIESDGVGFAKIMAVWALRNQKATYLTRRLQAFVDKGKDQETGFGGSIMDPRVGTYFPDSVKQAIRELLARWKAGTQ